MVTREYITNYLRVNGIPDNISTQALQAELLRIGWSQGDISDAVRVLHGDTPNTEVSNINKMLYSDASFSSEAVVSLLNVHVHHTPRNSHSSGRSTTTTEASHTIAAIGVAIVVAGVTFTAAMFFMKIGPFFG